MVQSMTSNKPDILSYNEINQVPALTKIFRAYDIRGIFDVEFNLEQVGKIANALVVCLARDHGILHPHIVIGRDGRLSSPAISNALKSALSNLEVQVSDVGCGPSPLLYYASEILKADAGIMVTGSHNGPEINGFKILIQNQALYGEGIQKLHDYMEREPEKISKVGVGLKPTLTEVEVKKSYREHLIGSVKFPFRSELKVAWDPGNGAAGEIILELVQALPGQHTVINERIDGNFPAHHPDPARDENLEQLRQVMLENHCDYGLAFDGDGDRVRVLLGSGKALANDGLMMLFAKEILRHHPGALMLFDIKTSDLVSRYVRGLDGKPMLCRAGHSYIKKNMRETGALFAGEMSGHFFFKDRSYGYDDGLYAALRFLELAFRGSGSIETEIGMMPVSGISREIEISCGVHADRFGLISSLQNALRQAKTPFTDLDGVRISNELGWFVVRASNTEDIIICRYEVFDAKEEEQLRMLINKQLATVGLKINDHF